MQAKSGRGLPHSKTLPRFWGCLPLEASLKIQFSPRDTKPYAALE